MKLMTTATTRTRKAVNGPLFFFFFSPRLPHKPPIPPNPTPLSIEPIFVHTGPIYVLSAVKILADELLEGPAVVLNRLPRAARGP
jgi:hypothetical protein